MTTADAGRPSVAIVGGGLAGLAAAVALADVCRVHLFEARRSLGGRAGSFLDQTTGQSTDHCQHVSMGCCTSLADFCRRTGSEQLFRRERRLHFISPEGNRFDLAASRLPAPLHLVPAFWGLKFLSVGERFGIGRAMWKLMRMRAIDDAAGPTIGAWLKRQKQSPRAIELFWNVILVSALAEELDRASLAAARKVIVDGFLSHREAYVVDVPCVPLDELYGRRLERWLSERGAVVRLNSTVRRVSADGEITLASGETLTHDYVVVAVPWHRVADIADERLAAKWPWLAEIDQVEASPITSVHLWFDRAIMPLDHAVLLGRLSQWIFKRDEAGENAAGHHYYQVVISASRNLAGRDRQEVVAEVCEELADIWPQAAEAKVLHSRMVTERAAVFSTRPGLAQVRPAQQTASERVLVAGDWTRTGWPATMEGAVRSGYLAAEAILRASGRPRNVLVPELPRGWLAGRLIRSEAQSDSRDARG